MALAAQLHLQQFLGRAGSKGIAAGTNHLGVSKIFGVNLLFHSNLAGVNANLLSIIAGGLKFNDTVDKGKDGKIPANTYVVTRVNARTPLPD